MSDPLTELHGAIEGRVRSIRHSRPEWPCQKGCDRCCHRLAEIPRLTEAEWILLREGMAQAPAEQRRQMESNLVRLTGQTVRPVVCPLLDEVAGACRVYHYRPVACRTYGFYVQRNQGLYCNDIEQRVAAGEWHDVVWGNQDSVDRQLRGWGVIRELTDWFRLSGSAIPVARI